MENFDNILRKQVDQSSELEVSLEQGIEERETMIQDRIDSLIELIEDGYEYQNHNKVVTDAKIAELKTILENTDSSANTSLIDNELDELVAHAANGESIITHEQELRRLQNIIGVHRNQKPERN
jgi:hypothetical protein